MSAKRFDLSDEEVEFILHAIAMHKNYIETGNPCVGAADVANVTGGQSDSASRKLAHDLLRAEIRALSVDQMRLIIKLDDLQIKLRSKS